MKTKLSKMWEIFFICLGAFVTVGLSIHSVLENDKKEKELANKTDSLMEAQEIINNKSEEIIQLQKELREKAEIQIISLLKLSNPIPKTFTLTIFSNIQTTTTELALLSTASANNGNMLPIENRNSIERIDKLKNAQIILKLTFKKEAKSMEIIFSQAPIKFIGFNTVLSSNVFRLATAQNQLQFSALTLATENIKTNYSSTSLLDFEKCDVTFEIEFGFAQRWIIGSHQADLYAIGPDSGLDIELNILKLTNSGRELIITDLKKIGKNKFKGKWNG